MGSGEAAAGGHGDGVGGGRRRIGVWTVGREGEVAVGGSRWKVVRKGWVGIEISASTMDGQGELQGRILLLCNGNRAHGNGTVGVSDSETLKGAEDLLQTDYTGYIKSV